MNVIEKVEFNGPTLRIKEQDNSRNKYQGYCSYNSGRFRFSFCEIECNNPVYKGHVSPIDGCDEAIKRKDGTEERKTIETKHLSIDEAKEVIAKKVIKYCEDPKTKYMIQGLIEESVNKETLSMKDAVLTYGETFIYKVNNKDNLIKTQIQNFNRLKFIAKNFFPEGSISKNTAREFNKTIKSGKILRSDINLISKFWTYLYEKGYCVVENTLNKPPRSKKDNIKIKNIVECMSVKQVEDLFTKLAKSINNTSIGTVLMLGAMLSERDVIDLRWEDLIFHDDRTYVCVSLYDSNAKATKTRTRPMLPWAAEILNDYHDKLKIENNGDEIKLGKKAIVSYSKRKSNEKSTSNKKDRIRDNLQDFNKKLIRKHILTYDEYCYLKNSNLDVAACYTLFRNSYCNLLETVCNLNIASGEYLYLTGKSLNGNVTMDSYVSFSHEDAQRNLHKILSCCNKEVFYEKEEPIASEDGNTLYIVSPTTSRCNYQAKQSILLKGNKEGEIIVACDSGILGYFRILNNTENNSNLNKF